MKPVDSPTVELRPWSGTWADDDPDANFKHDVALYSHLDPLSTLTNLSAAVDIPVGSLCRYILAKWTAAGAEALMALGPSAVNRLAATIEAAEAAGTTKARLDAYEDLAAQVSWLAAGMDA